MVTQTLSTCNKNERAPEYETYKTILRKMVITRKEITTK